MTWSFWVHLVLLSYVLPKGFDKTNVNRSDVVTNFPVFYRVTTENILSWQGDFTQGILKGFFFFGEKNVDILLCEE